MAVRTDPDRYGDGLLARPTRPKPHGFTLIEILIVVGIMGVLASVLIAQFNGMIGAGRAESISVTVRHVRELIELKAATHTGPVAASGYPTTVDPAWFQGGKLPYHTWTRSPMRVEVVNLGDTVIFPAEKVFDATDPIAKNAWYNTTNGAFCVRVGDEGSDVARLRAFNTANGCSVTQLDQTSP